MDGRSECVFLFLVTRRPVAASKYTSNDGRLLSKIWPTFSVRSSRGFRADNPGRLGSAFPQARLTTRESQLAVVTTDGARVRPPRQPPSTTGGLAYARDRPGPTHRRGLLGFWIQRRF